MNHQKKILDIFNEFVKTVNRPGFNGHNFSADWHIFLNIDGTVNGVIPNRWIISSVDHVNLHFNGTRQWRITFVLSHRFEFVCLTLITSIRSATKIKVNEVDEVLVLDRSSAGKQTPKYKK